jgi:predicted XRE-type DNA-binding protein
VGQERDTTVKVQQSTGNVFRDLEFGAHEGESLRLRAELMVEVRRLIQTRKLAQRSAANLLGVTQPRISDLIRGKIDLFSIDTLVNMLARAGMRVQLRIAGGRGRRAQAA